MTGACLELSADIAERAAVVMLRQQLQGEKDFNLLLIDQAKKSRGERDSARRLCHYLKEKAERAQRGAALAIGRARDEARAQWAQYGESMVAKSQELAEARKDAEEFRASFERKFDADLDSLSSVSPPLSFALGFALGGLVALVALGTAAHWWFLPGAQP